MGGGGDYGGAARIAFHDEECGHVHQSGTVSIAQVSDRRQASRPECFWTRYATKLGLANVRRPRPASRAAHAD